MNCWEKHAITLETIPKDCYLDGLCKTEKSRRLFPVHLNALDALLNSFTNNPDSCPNSKPHLLIVLCDFVFSISGSTIRRFGLKRISINSTKSFRSLTPLPFPSNDDSPRKKSIPNVAGGCELHGPSGALDVS